MIVGTASRWTLRGQAMPPLARSVLFHLTPLLRRNRNQPTFCQARCPVLTVGG